MRIVRTGSRLGRVILAFGTAIVLAAAAPAAAFANPPDTQTVPEDGSRPAGGVDDTGGDITDVPVDNPDSIGGPLIAQIEDETIWVAHLGEQTTAARDDLAVRQQQVTATHQALANREVAVADIKAQITELGTDAYRQSAVDIDSGLGDDLNGLSGLQPDGEIAGLDAALSAAEEHVELAQASYDAAQAAAARAQIRYDLLSAELAEHDSALQDLIAENQEAIAEAEAERAEAAEDYLGDFSTEVDGWQASPEAIEAVNFALSQLGKPYEWGAEGPNTYDCSGLVQTSYAHAGVQVARVAADQYRTTADKPVDTEKLLPGDLIFYGDRPGDWTSVYHVTMYIGDGQMVQAPRTGDVVKVSPVSFGNYFGAHRVVDAIPVDGQTDPSDSPTSSPTDDPDDDPTTSPSPPDDATPTEGPDDDPTDDPSDDPTDDPSEDPDDDPSDDPTDDPTDDPSEDPTTSPSPSPDEPSPSPTSSPSATSSSTPEDETSSTPQSTAS